MRLTAAGERRHYVTLANPGPPVSDGDGGYTQTSAPLSPSGVSAQILPATARDLERRAAGTVITTATHVVTMPYHAGVTTQTVITFGTRTFSVVGVSNPEERNRETVVLAVEMVA